MLRSIIITPDQEQSEQLQDLLSEIGHIGVIRVVDKYPTAIELVRTLRAHAPQVIFLGVDAVDKATEAIAGIEQSMPGVQIVAIARICEPQALLELMRIGVREFVAMPFRRTDLHEALGRITETLEKKPLPDLASDLMFSFLPSKPGVGTSTVALNAALAAAKVPDSRALLIDLDLNSGMQRFMLKLDNEYCITDAAENSFKMDDNLWPQLVTSIGQLDVLHSGKLNPNYRVESSQVRHLLDFARRMYKVVCIDLSGNMEKYSLEVMQESKYVFLVCTPEIASLHLARERFNFLKNVDLGDRVRILLNRSQKKAAIEPSQIEDLLGIPVLMTLPNDYQAVSKALASGKHVDPSTELGKQFTKLSNILFERKVPQQAEKSRRFVEYFNLQAMFSGSGDVKKPAKKLAD